MMRTVRRLAVYTLETVIKLSAAERQRWGTAMLAEIDSIRSDWEALLWATGSVRLLFVPWRTQTTTVVDIPAAAMVLAARTKRRTWGGALVVFWEALYFATKFFHEANVLQRSGCAGVVVAMLFLFWQLVEGRSGGTEPNASIAEQAAFYRSELKREYDFYRGRLFWTRFVVLLPGFLLFSVGNIVANPATIHTQVISLVLFLFCWLLAIPNCYYAARGYARELWQLDQMKLEGSFPSCKSSQ